MLFRSRLRSRTGDDRLAGRHGHRFPVALPSGSGGEILSTHERQPGDFSENFGGQADKRGEKADETGENAFVCGSVPGSDALFCKKYVRYVTRTIKTDRPTCFVSNSCANSKNLIQFTNIMNISSGIDEFMLYMTSLGRSDNTIVNYAVDLAQFADYMEAAGVSSLSELKMDFLRAFLRELSGYGFSKSSVARKLSSLRGFVKYLARTGTLDRDISIGLKGPKLPTSLPRALAYEDVLLLLEGGPRGNKKELRDQLLLELLYSSGLRVNELTSLDWKDVDYSDRKSVV